MNKLLLTLFISSLLIVCAFSTTNNYIYTVVGQYGTVNNVLIVNPFATNENGYIIANASISYTRGVLDILSFDSVDNTLLVYGNIGAYNSLVSINPNTGFYKEIGQATNQLSYSYTPQKVVLIDNIIYLPANNGQTVELLQIDFNNEITNALKLYSPTFSFGSDQSLIQGYDPINNKLYIGYSTTGESVNLIEVTLNLNFNSSGSASDSSQADTQYLYEEVQGFSTFEYIFTDNNGQVYIVGRDSTNNILLCKFDKDSNECPTLYNYGLDISNLPAQAYFLSQDRNTFTLIGPPTSDPTSSSTLQLVQFQVNNNMAYSESPIFPNYWNSSSISGVAIAM